MKFIQEVSLWETNTQCSQIIGVHYDPQRVACVHITLICSGHIQALCRLQTLKTNPLNPNYKGVGRDIWGIVTGSCSEFN